MSWFQKLKQKLVKTSSSLSDGIINIFHNKTLDAALLEEFEDLLLTSDMGQEIAKNFVTELKKSKFHKSVTALEIQEFLQEQIAKTLTPIAQPLDLQKHLRTGNKPVVILLCGVNGNGKTTTAGKLGTQLQQSGLNVILGACDTFRAAAVEQLEIWGSRINIPVIVGHPNSDPASVAYQALQQAKNDNVDVLILDTAGRLHNKTNLMDELQKCVRVLKKLDTNAPHEIIMVVDSTTGQNAYSQISTFNNIVPITGLIFTKLDSTAKGGVIVGVAQKYKIPIYAIGIGEKIDDLQPFNPLDLARSIVSHE